jgi:putative heme-binding domain-containing protein
MRVERRLIRVGIVVLAAVAWSSHAQNHAGQYEQADIEYGARLYSGHCVVCHGDRGDAMPGVNLASGRFRHAERDRDVVALIRIGVPGTAMAPSAYTDSELDALVAYLRNMSSVEVGSLPQGDAVRGRALFEGKGNCAGCHRVGAAGPRGAPDLSNVGATRSAATLQRVLVDPDAAMLPINRPVRAVLRDGTVVMGRRLNEDTFTVQLVDSSGQLRSLDKATVREYSLGEQATMPSYAGALTEDEQSDLVAYMLSLKGVN